MKINNNRGGGGGYHLTATSSISHLVNLHNRVGEERQRQTLCDKHDNNSVCKNPPPIFKSKKYQC